MSVASTEIFRLQMLLYGTTLMIGRLIPSLRMALKVLMYILQQVNLVHYVTKDNKLHSMVSFLVEMTLCNFYGKNKNIVRIRI